MKNYRFVFLFSFLMIAFSISSFSQHSISGDDEACFGECKTYNLSGGVGGPYYWQSTGEIEGTNQGNEVKICWNTIGTNSIRLVDFSASAPDQIQTIDVAVVGIPEPQIIPPVYPVCTTKDSIPPNGEQDFEVVECISACSASVGFYSFEENYGAATSWEVEGGSILSTSAEGITVEWNASGTGSIKLTETNSLGCAESTVYCVEILEPLDVDILAFNGGANSINVCADQEVYLQALGTIEATSFEWVLDDGRFEYGANISTSYSEGGTYDIMLIGSSECKCFDTSYYQIIVDVNPGPEITCTGTTCGDEAHTYYAGNTCGSYFWTISANGMITEGGGTADDYVTINWNNGPVGTVSLSVSGCSEAVCAEETIVQIPILDGSATIVGPTEACKNGHSNYSVQYYNGTEYIWNISGNGTIINGWGTNQITVQWSDDPFADYTSSISVDYENCYLECGGQASINVDLKPAFDISHSEEVCAGRNMYFSSVEGWNSAIVTWTITSPSGIVSTYTNESYFNVSFLETGTYSVLAEDIDNDFCNEQVSSFFEVVELPDRPLYIEGPLVICLNEYYNYSVPLPEPGISVIWEIRDGSNSQQIRANTVSIQWTSNGPYEIQVSYISDDINCRSDRISETMQLAQNATISGTAITCVDEVETYSIGATNGTTPDWNIVPSDAGSIIHNPDNTIDVMWHTAGSHQISSDYCGATLSYIVDVNPLGINDVIYIKEICPGEVTPITCTLPAGSSVIIRDEAEFTIGTSPVVNVPYGKYEVEITSIDGCVEVIPVVIDTFLPPTIRVSSPDENAFCQPHPNVSIVALNTKDGYTYEWYHDNVAMGETSPSISTSQYGDYHVEVTDINGCTAISNIHTLHEWCVGDPPPGTCTGAGHGEIGISEISLRCNSKQFSVWGSSFTSTSFSWNFGDPDSGVNNSSTETSPIHNFTYAGYYYVSVRGNVPGENGIDIFTVPAAPKFDYEDACAGNEVQFRNHSTFIPGFDIINYSWNFGDPSSGADNTSNDENPVHIYDNAGSYTAILEIESSNGCMSTYELEVIVEDGPLAEFIVPISACSNEGLLFEALQDDDIYTYEWDFGDPSSGTSNASNNPIAIHTFSGSGSYNVSLSVSDGNNCTQSITKTINVTSTSLSGDIVADQLFPICYGEEVTLTAPNGGDAYLWSDGSLGQSITVSDPGVYYVTMTDNSGCNYVPDPVNVVVEGILDVDIRATHLIDQFFGPSYFDSLEICQGELFSLSTNWISGASYLWSTGHTSTYVNQYDIAGLPSGRHLFHVSVTDPLSGCEIESKPMTIIVNPLPSSIQISSDTPDPCEGQEHVLSIDNPESDLIYYWNNGDTGLSTTVSRGGFYFVTAKNKNGCERESNRINIAPLSNANRINLGCTEACFPDTICVPFISGASSYQWLLDGVPVTGTNGNVKDLIAIQAGEYQLIVENYFGCQDTSDILSIEATPSDQSVSGIVFIDDNNNGVWDIGEELLVGVPVHLYSGSVLETTVLTDNGGFYIFDPVLISNPSIEIDTTGLGLDLSGSVLQDDIEFDNCIEDKTKDFPLNKECATSSENVELFTCVGESIMINSVELEEGDTYTFMDLNIAGCDSMTLVSISAYPQANVNLFTSESCQNIDNGALNITIMSGTGLQFAVDNPSIYTSSLQFDGLTPGMHILWITDDNNCTQTFEFEIQETVTPLMTILPQNSCENSSNGSVSIMPPGAGNYQYSMDGIVFSSSSTFDNLSVDSYTVYVQEDNNCVYQYDFDINSIPVPQFDFNTEPTCNAGASGTVEITPMDMGSFEYSLDNTTFSAANNFNDLPSGTHVLYVQEVGGCLHNYSFEILEAETPQIEITPELTCEGEDQGVISISPITNGNYEYSLDGISYSNDLEFYNLPAGQHMVYLLEDGVCQYQFSTNINTTPMPSVTFTIEEACVGEANGSIHINTSETGLSYSMDNINYSTSDVIADLNAGMHTIYVQSQNNCVHSYDVEILEAGGLEVEFVEPVLDCSVEQVNLAPVIIDAFGDVSYAWETGETDSTLVINRSGQYTLSVADKCSIQEYTWDIQMEEITKDQPIYFPNIFSPNQDGINECFLPVLNPETTILSYRLVIFDRWGNKYFETTDMNECWNGMYNGKNVRTGVFVYLLEMDYTYCVEVENLKKYGDVTITH